MFENRKIIKPLCKKIKIQDDDLYNNFSYDDCVNELCEILEKRVIINDEREYSRKRICQKPNDYQFNFKPFLRVTQPNFEIPDQDDGDVENNKEYSNNESISTCKIVPDNDYLNIFVDEVNFMEQTTNIQQHFNRKIKQCENKGVKKRICKQKYSRTN